MHNVIGVSKPKHPLFSILRFENFPQPELTHRTKLISDFYQIALKKECPCKMQYGQTPFDFDEGIISCFAPKQVSIVDTDFAFAKVGWVLSIHPDFLRTYPLSRKMKSFGFFDYDVNEALILSEDELQSIEIIIGQIEKEYLLPIDRFSQEVIISALDLLFTHFNRYYNRQFVTRQYQSSELLNRVENLLNACFSDTGEQELPTPAYLASQLNMSCKYLSDCLKQLTGQTAQQLIHDKLIEKAKDILTTTQLSVSEVAYLLGFEYPQSFNKLFKNKTALSPLEFRQSFN
ncbi:helix-turn-helix domain-containing protein [Algoriphagus resistens]|uniref:helix-turn-helix domain-containing protein n=1 Tax=Algoriphagus resistens TaxID=1750590 RepID=UPI000716B006|nr:helix-turn-helix domain-containing protein [Algoriphagus resistens]